MLMMMMMMMTTAVVVSIESGFGGSMAALVVAFNAAAT